MAYTVLQYPIAVVRASGAGYVVGQYQPLYSTSARWNISSTNSGAKLLICWQHGSPGPEQSCPTTGVRKSSEPNRDMLRAAQRLLIKFCRQAPWKKMVPGSPFPARSVQRCHWPMAKVTTLPKPPPDTMILPYCNTPGGNYVYAKRRQMLRNP